MLNQTISWYNIEIGSIVPFFSFFSSFWVLEDPNYVYFIIFDINNCALGNDFLVYSQFKLPIMQAAVDASLLFIS